MTSAVPSSATASMAAGRVPEVLITTTSPGSRNRGRKVKVLGTSDPSLSVATSMRTASRVSPRASGGSDASSAVGQFVGETLGAVGQRRS